MVTIGIVTLRLQVLLSVFLLLGKVVHTCAYVTHQAI